MRSIWHYTRGKEETMGGLPVRKEVEAFCKSAETLLSPAVLGHELTPEECMLIADYVMNLANTENPWGKYFMAPGRNSMLARDQ